MSATSDTIPAAIRPFSWSVRREIWENRSIYIAPLVVAGLMLFGFAVGLVAFARHARDLSREPTAVQVAQLAQPYNFVALAVIVTSLIVASVYCLGALNGERRDRSILFWKSLPVSDLTTVAAKAAIPIAVIPAATIVIVIATQLAMLLVSTLVMLAVGVSLSPLLGGLPLWRMEGVLIYGLATLAIWHAPLYAWMLLVSGYARRVTFLWAFLPPVGLMIVEGIAFHTHYVAEILGRRIVGGFAVAFADQASDSPDRLPHIDPLKFLGTPEVWIGMAAAAALFGGAVYQRRYREPI